MPTSLHLLASNASIPQRCDRDCIKETGISCQHSAARHRNGGKPEEAFLLWRHDNTANAPFSFLSTSDFKMATRWFRQTEGDRFLPSTSFFQCMHPVREDVVIMYTHRTTVLLLYSGLCDIRVLFMYDAGLHAWHIAPVRFNNVRLCPSIFISSISGLLRRPRVLNPARRLASLMR